MGGVAQSRLAENWISGRSPLSPSRFCFHAYQPISRGTGTCHLRGVARRILFAGRPPIIGANSAPLPSARTMTRPLCVSQREIKFDRQPSVPSEFHLPFAVPKDCSFFLSSFLFFFFFPFFFHFLGTRSKGSSGFEFEEFLAIANGGRMFISRKCNKEGRCKIEFYETIVRYGFVVS